VDSKPSSRSLEKEKATERSATMKRIEAFILSEKTESVLASLEALNLQATFYGSKGMGKGEKYMISYGLGAGTAKTSYSNRSTVVTIVEESDVERVILAIKETAKTGKQNAGVIVISPVESMHTI
jgi:nitrogen regulatory protein P-II 1